MAEINRLAAQTQFTEEQIKVETEDVVFSLVCLYSPFSTEILLRKPLIVLHVLVYT